MVGDVQMADLVSKLESKLAGWKKADVPKNIPATIKPVPGKKNLSY